MTPVIVVTTVGAMFDAATLANDLVSRHLAACVNIVPHVRSIYRWQGEIEDDGEQILIIKTTDERLAELREVVLSRHPYEVPEFFVMQPDQIEGPYRDWLIDAVRK